MVEAVHLWNSGLTTDVLPWGIGESLKELRIEIQIAGIAALFGLVLIIGLKYASIIAAGSVVRGKAILEPNSLYAGTPAKRIKAIEPEQFERMVKRIARDYMMYADWYR